METIIGIRMKRPVAELEDHLGYWLRFVSNQVSYAFSVRLAARDVTVAEWVILRELYDQTAVRPSTLAERLGMTRGAISKLVDRLEAKALLARATNTEDRRYQALALTPAGDELVPQLSALADANDAEFFGHPRYSPYVIGGIGYFSFNPQTKLGNRYVDLQPLHTEGQGFAEYPDRKEYKLNQLMIPLGLGVKYELTPLINVRGEFLYRKTFTDYIDDVSTTYIDPALFSKYLEGGKLTNALAIYDKQRIPIAGVDGKRGTATNNDGYFSFSLKVSVVIGRDRIRRY